MQLPTRPAASAQVSAAPSPTQSARDLVLDVQELPAIYETDFSTLFNAGDALVWATGNQIWRYGLDGTPELVYTGAEGTAVEKIAASSAGYLFVTVPRAGGVEPYRWRLYFLSLGGSDPFLMDKFDNAALLAPDIAINGTYAAWAVAHGEGADEVSMLRAVKLHDLAAPQTLQSYALNDTWIGDPSLWRDELWYGVSDNDWTNDQAHPRVEMINLGDPGSQPLVYGRDVRAFMPAANDQVVSWKGGESDDFAALDAAAPFVYWRATGVTQQLPLPGDIQFPTVGNRFIAWWDMRAEEFYVYDIAQHQLREIASYSEPAPRYLGPSVSGNVLSWVYFATDRTPGRIQWAYLPE